MGLYAQLLENAEKRIGGKTSFLEKACYSLLSGGLGAIFSNPADLAMVRFQNDGLLPKK